MENQIAKSSTLNVVKFNCVVIVGSHKKLDQLGQRLQRNPTATLETNFKTSITLRAVWLLDRILSITKQVVYNALYTYIDNGEKASSCWFVFLFLL